MFTLEEHLGINVPFTTSEVLMWILYWNTLRVLGFKHGFFFGVSICQNHHDETGTCYGSLGVEFELVSPSIILHGMSLGSPALGLYTNLCPSVSPSIILHSALLY